VSASASERWLVVDERRFPSIVFDTRVLADTLMTPVPVVAYAAVAWHTKMRQFPAPVLAAEVAAYARCGERTARDGLRTAQDLGYVSSTPRAGKAPLYELVAARDFPLPLWPSPWRHEARAPGLRTPAPQAQGEHRWLVDVDVHMNSYVQLDCRVLADTRLDALSVVLHASLGWHAGAASRSTWLSLVSLAAYTGAHQATVADRLERLVDAGYITQHARPGRTHLFTLIDPPAPDEGSPWTPAAGRGVADPGPRETPEAPSARENGFQGPLRAKHGPGGDPPTPAADRGVFSTTPAADRGDPGSRSRRTTNPTNHVPGSGSTRSSTGNGRPGDDDRSGSSDDQVSRETPGHRAATERATFRAIRLAPAYAVHVADDPTLLEDFCDRIRNDITHHRDRHLIDADSVIDAARSHLLEHLARPAAAAPRVIDDGTPR
jgi:hypothetical protein